MVDECFHGGDWIIFCIYHLRMSYFTWKESGLTSDCSSLEAMAARFEEAASLMRRMANEGFKLKKHNGRQIITHENLSTFEDWGFISEQQPFKQLTLIPD